MSASYAGMSVQAYRDSARAWLESRLHSRFGVRHTDLYFAPMMELKDLLLSHGFQVWIYWQLAACTQTLSIIDAEFSF